MVSTLSTSEEAQLAQTIEMFEVITQSQPQDYQSLEILKEAYAKLGRDKDAINTSKRIAEAYVQMGQLSSAILEYETILQRCPDDPDVQAALQRIESKATNFPMEQAPPAIETPAAKPVSSSPKFAKPVSRAVSADVEDGRRMMHKIFVDTKIITAGDFDLCWVKQDLAIPPNGVVEPFVQILSDKGILPLEKALKVICDHSRLGYIPMQSYDIDIDLARSFPAETCQRWCIMPFDRMSKCILVATTNPFNQQAAKDLSEATPNRLLWYIVSPTELVKTLRKAFR
jgi:tetratricopeptide (TPR) repeat protein